MRFVCLTFDLDAASSWIQRGLTSPTAISRGEFGVVGADRVLALLDRFHIASTWFIPGHTIETYPELCRRVHGAGHEIGHHGYLHEPPMTLSREEEEAVLIRGIDCIQLLTGSRPRGYRSPSWDLSPSTIDLLLGQGFAYDSSMMAHDYQPYPARRGDVITTTGPLTFGQPTRLLEIPISWSLDDYVHFEYVRSTAGIQPGLQWAGGVLENWTNEYRFMLTEVEHGVLTYTFHPDVIGRGYRMVMLEHLIQSLIELGATFLRMEEAAREFADCLPQVGSS